MTRGAHGQAAYTRRLDWGLSGALALVGLGETGLSPGAGAACDVTDVVPVLTPDAFVQTRVS